jgi:hypothetical protein
MKPDEIARYVQKVTYQIDGDGEFLPKELRRELISNKKLYNRGIFDFGEGANFMFSYYDESSKKISSLVFPIQVIDGIFHLNCLRAFSVLCAKHVRDEGIAMELFETFKNMLVKHCVQNDIKSVWT